MLLWTEVSKMRGPKSKRGVKIANNVPKNHEGHGETWNHPN